ncbi:hypothetical protein D3C81_1965770 [compost metagenome]
MLRVPPLKMVTYGTSQAGFCFTGSQAISLPDQLLAISSRPSGPSGIIPVFRPSWYTLLNGLRLGASGMCS